jgi:hypothetical protein
MISPATAFCGLIYASLFFMAFDCLPFDWALSQMNYEMKKAFGAHKKKLSLFIILFLIFPYSNAETGTEHTNT